MPRKIFVIEEVKRRFPDQYGLGVEHASFANSAYKLEAISEPPTPSISYNFFQTNDPEWAACLILSGRVDRQEGAGYLGYLMAHNETEEERQVK